MCWRALPRRFSPGVSYTEVDRKRDKANLLMLLVACVEHSAKLRDVWWGAGPVSILGRGCGQVIELMQEASAMRRALLLLVWLPLLACQAPKKTISPVPADRRVDTYAVYSVVLAHPSLSHADNNEKYIVDELSDFAMENEPQSCITVPEAYRANFVELLADRSEHHLERFRLGVCRR